MLTSHLFRSVSRKLIIGLSIPLILVGLVCGWWSFTRFTEQRVRADWMATTLPRLASLSLTNEDIYQELEALKASRKAGDRQEWTGDRVLLMSNDEYLVYASRHGFNNGFVDHLFLAHGSDGSWYYSTFHFCNHMVGVISDNPPASIAEFARTYSARRFDGKSTMCLQHTWPEKK